MNEQVTAPTTETVVTPETAAPATPAVPEQKTDANGTPETLIGGEAVVAPKEEPTPATLAGEQYTADTLKEIWGGDDFNAEDPLALSAMELINTATDKETLARGLYELSGKVRETAAAELTQAYNDQQEAGRDAIRAAYPGPALETSLATANEVATQYGGDEFKELLRTTGAGNQLAMMKFLLAVKAAIPGEGVPVSGQPAGITKDRAERMFGG